ncbi:hypothetical protein AOLI_G00091210 [Acnodon oligacanthus]
MALSGNRPACPPTAAVMLYSKLRSIRWPVGQGTHTHRCGTARLDPGFTQLSLTVNGAPLQLWDSSCSSLSQERSEPLLPEALGATLADLEVVGTKRRGQSQRGSMELEVNRGEKEDGGIAGWRDGRRALGHLGVLIESALQWDEPGLRLGRSVDR